MSFPRRRETNDIKFLDPRLRGDDYLFSVALMFQVLLDVLAARIRENAFTWRLFAGHRVRQHYIHVQHFEVALAVK